MPLVYVKVTDNIGLNRINHPRRFINFRWTTLVNLFVSLTVLRKLAGFLCRFAGKAKTGRWLVFLLCFLLLYDVWYATLSIEIISFEYNGMHFTTDGSI